MRLDGDLCADETCLKGGAGWSGSRRPVDEPLLPMPRYRRSDACRPGDMKSEYSGRSRCGGKKGDTANGRATSTARGIFRSKTGPELAAQVGSPFSTAINRPRHDSFMIT